MKKYMFGPLVVGMQGDNSLVDLLAADFDSVTSSEDKDIDLFIDLSLDGFEEVPTNFIAKGDNYFNHKAMVVDRNPYFSYSISSLFDDAAITRLHIKIKKPNKVRKILSWLKIAASIDSGSRDKFIRGQFANYSLLWAVVAIALLKKGFSFIHAGVVNTEEGAVLISGTGGGGKTSTTMCLVDQKVGSYLAEDFAIIGRDGTVFYSPKTISFYESDLRWGGGVAERVRELMSTAVKIKWNFLVGFVGVNPVFKASPSSVFDIDQLRGGHILNKAIYMRRVAGGKGAFQKISGHEFSERSSWASIREIYPFLDVLCSVKANMSEGQEFLSPDDIRRKMYEIYSSAINARETFLMSVPTEAKPSGVCTSLLDGIA